MENVIKMHGTRHKGRLPPVVSSLFSVKAAHWSGWYQTHGAESKGQGADGWKTRAALSVICYLLSVPSLLEDAGDRPASTELRSNLELRRLAQAPLQL